MRFPHLVSNFLSLVSVTSLVISCVSSSEENKPGKDDKLFSLLPSSSTGVKFSNSLTTAADFNIIEYLYFYNGGGVAVGDINNDGLDDLFFTSNQGSNKLYINKGDLRFEDISESAQLNGDLDWSTGVTMADVNGDGWLDIYVSQVANYKGLTGHNLLYINNGDQTFSEKAEEYGLAFQGFGTQAVFFDYDLDGDLDVYLLNHSVHTVGNYGDAENLKNQISEQAGDRLFQSQLAQGSIKFMDVTKQSGIYSSPIGYGLGVSAADINGDYLPDLYITNDFHEDDYLYINNGDGTFKESLAEFLPHTSRYAMGNDIADINGDGLLDIISTDMLPSDPSILLKSGGEDKQEVYDIKLGYGYKHQLARNSLQLNRGNGKFSDIALYTNTYATDWSWAPLIADFDNDGEQDIFITNGIYKRPNDLDYIQYISNLSDYRYNTANEDNITAEMIKRMPSLKISNTAFRNNGLLSFESVGRDWGLEEPSYSNGSAYADLDNDGDLDLVVNNVNQEAFLYRNNSNKLNVENGYLKIELKGDGLNKYGIGAQVDFYSEDKRISKTITTTRGFQSAVSPTLTVGLGKASSVDSVIVHWPDGLMQVEMGVQTRQHLIITKNASRKRSKTPRTEQFFVALDNPLIDFRHRENLKFKDYNSSYLLPYRLSTEGPAVVIGDFTGDKMDDIYFGGAAGQSGALYIQSNALQFMPSGQPALFKDRMFEDVDAQFVDVDGDDDLDLVVASGGNQHPKGYPLLANRLYLNENGTLVRSEALAQWAVNSSVIKALDFDQDGDQDLLVGNDADKGLYGISGSIQLLENDGNGNFIDVSSHHSSIKEFQGMVKDLTLCDVNSDGLMDIVIAAHWQPISILVSVGGIYSRIQNVPNSSGLWNTIYSADIDNDGDDDLIAGNIGLNNKFTATEKLPLRLFIDDYDGNGKLDPVIMQPLDDRYVPVLSKDELAKQLPIIHKNHTSYSLYAESIFSFEDLFPNEEFSELSIMEVNELESIVLINDSSEFSFRPLPQEFQYSSINSILLDDVNKDGNLDLITGGNSLYMHVNLGRLDGDYGSLAFGNGDGTFNYVQNSLSGFKVNGQVSQIKKVKLDSESIYMFAINNDSLQLYK